jgi:hypothetical protein
MREKSHYCDEEMSTFIDTHLCRDDHLITNISFLEPLSNDPFTLLILTIYSDKYAMDMVTCSGAENQ